MQATVHHGQLRLTGTVPWYYLYLEAERSVRHIRGVRQVINDIRIAPASAGRDLRKRITTALYRNAGLDARRIDVTISGNVARLTGTATSWQQRRAAEQAAYNAPGIVMVENQIVVDPPDDDNCEIC